MAYAADYFDIMKRGFSQGDHSRPSVEDQFNEFLDDLLIDEDFDKIGVLDVNGPEFDMYRELGALPEDYR